MHRVAAKRGHCVSFVDAPVCVREARRRESMGSEFCGKTERTEKEGEGWNWLATACVIRRSTALTKALRHLKTRLRTVRECAR